MPGPNPKFKNKFPREIRGQANKKSRGSLGKGKPIKEVVPAPPPKKMKKGGKA
jgi:hypothetical protein